MVFALFVGCFLFDWVFFIPCFEAFPAFLRVQGQTSGCAAHSLPRWCSTLLQAPGYTVSRATSLPAIGPGGGCEQAPNGYSQISELQLDFQSLRTSSWSAFVYPWGARTGRGHCQRLSPLASYMMEPTKFPSVTSPWSKMSYIWLKHPNQETWTDVSTSSTSPSLVCAGLNWSLAVCLQLAWCLLVATWTCKGNNLKIREKVLYAIIFPKMCEGGRNI